MSRRSCSTERYQRRGKGSLGWKKNIQEIDNALDKVLAIRSVYFDWDEEHGGQHDIGFIAEEVDEQILEVVSYEMDLDKLSEKINPQTTALIITGMQRDYILCLRNLKFLLSSFNSNRYYSCS